MDGSETVLCRGEKEERRDLFENKSFQEDQSQFKALDKTMSSNEENDEEVVDSDTSVLSLSSQETMDHYCPATFDMMKNKMQGDFVSYYFLYVRQTI